MTKLIPQEQSHYRVWRDNGLHPTEECIHQSPNGALAHEIASSERRRGNRCWVTQTDEPGSEFYSRPVFY